MPTANGAISNNVFPPHHHRRKPLASTSSTTSSASKEHRSLLDKKESPPPVQNPDKSKSAALTRNLGLRAHLEEQSKRSAHSAQRTKAWLEDFDNGYNAATSVRREQHIAPQITKDLSQKVQHAMRCSQRGISLDRCGADGPDGDEAESAGRKIDLLGVGSWALTTGRER